MSDLDKTIMHLVAEIEKTVLSIDSKLVTLSSLHVWFIELFNEGKPPESKLEQSGYPSWKLKEKLKKHFRDKLLFIAQPGMSDLVCSSEVTIGDALKKVSVLNIQISEIVEREYTTSGGTGEHHVYHSSSSSWYPS